MRSSWRSSSGEGEGSRRANAEGNTGRGDDPVHEVCKSNEGREKEEGQRLEGNGRAGPGPDHLIWEEREVGISWIWRMGRQ